MSSGTQIEPPSPNGGYGGQVWPGEGTPPSGNVSHGGTSGAGAYLTDEEILGIEPVATVPSNRRDVIPFTENAHRERNDNEKIMESPQAGSVAMPAWMQAVAGDPQHGAEAQQLWQEHQAFRAAFSSPEEARAIKEMFPGGVSEVQALRQTSQSVEQIDAAIFSGDARAQSEVIAEIARANPTAFRSLFAEAPKVLAGIGQTITPSAATDPIFRNSSGQALRENRGEWGTRPENQPRDSSSGVSGVPPRNDGANSVAAAVGANHPSQGFSASESQITNHSSQELRASRSPQFDPAAYSNFERTTNDVVARDVRSTISDTLARVLPEGVAEGASRRIGEDIFNEIHRALAGDRTLSEQVGETLRASVASGQGWRFGTAEQQRVASLLAGRARQLVPSVARRVIGEWTSSVLGTARSKAARQAAAASRVDIAAAGGSLDSMPLRAMSAREVDYASMSDDEILGL